MNRVSKKSPPAFIESYLQKYILQCKLIKYSERRDSYNYFGTKFNTIGNPLVYYHRLKQLPTNHTLPYICTSGDQVGIVIELK